MMTQHELQQADRSGAGFGCSMSPYEARRQWSLSLAVVIGLAVAIVACLATGGILPAASGTHPVWSAEALIVHRAVATNPGNGSAAPEASRS